MFQRFISKPTQNNNRESDYKFDDLRDIGSDDEDKNNSPEKFILKGLSERNKKGTLKPLDNRSNSLSASSRVDLKPLRPLGAAESKEEFNDDFVVEFKQDELASPKPEAPAAPAVEPSVNKVRFEVFDDATPVKPMKQSFLISPDARFKSDRNSDKTKENETNAEQPIRAPEAKASNSSSNTIKQPTKIEDTFEVEDMDDDEFDVEQLFSKIRHNRMEFVVESFEAGCDPFVKVRYVIFVY
jgi:hypothetical protein